MAPADLSPVQHRPPVRRLGLEFGQPTSRCTISDIYKKIALNKLYRFIYVSHVCHEYSVCCSGKRGWLRGEKSRVSWAPPRPRTTSSLFFSARTAMHASRVVPFESSRRDISNGTGLECVGWELQELKKKCHNYKSDEQKVGESHYIFKNKMKLSFLLPTTPATVVVRPQTGYDYNARDKLFRTVVLLSAWHHRLTRWESELTLDFLFSWNISTTTRSHVKCVVPLGRSFHGLSISTGLGCIRLKLIKSNFRCGCSRQKSLG